MRIRNFISFLMAFALCWTGVLAQSGKMSPYLRRISMQYAQCARMQSVLDVVMPVSYTTALVRTADVSALEDNGCHILASWDDIHAVSVPVGKLSTLASLPQIQRIEANEVCSLTNDTTAGIVGVCASPFVSQKVKDVRNTYGLNGAGVLVGVMDVGFDLTNPNYLTQDAGRYRVKAVWDQLDFTDGGSPVAFRMSADSLYTAPGRQYTDEASILQKRATADSLFVFHGCHTSGTAVGSGLGGEFQKPLRWSFQYAGMAPEADLCIVSNAVGDNSSLIPDERRSEFTTATDILGFKYIFDYADRAGKPCVINFSEGSHQNLQNNQLYNEVLERMIGSGRIICVSAGNEGTKGSYIHKSVGEDTKGAFLMAQSEYAYYTMDSKQPVNFTLTFYKSAADKQQRTYNVGELNLTSDSIWIDTVQVFDNRYAITLQTYPNCYDNQKHATELLVTDLQQNTFAQSDIKVSITLNGLDNDIEAYESGGYFVKDSYDTSLADFTYDHNILFPGSSPSVITVGFTSYVTPRKNLYNNLAGVNFGIGGVIAGYSSKGPTMNGQTKPDVVAPGTNIISGHSSFYSNDLTDENSWFTNVSTWNGRKYPWRLNSGSSMASPVVTGIIALWLQECPSLTPDEIRDVFANTCHRRDLSLSYPNNTWGWGEIDAVAGIEYIREHYTGVDEINAYCSDVLNGSGHSNFQEYDLTGRLIPVGSNYHGIAVTQEGKFFR